MKARGSIVCAMLVTGAVSAQWTQFRGPNGSGTDSSTGFPAEFSPTKNVAWKAAVPYGQSSPAIAGNRVYLTASDGDKRVTICFEATSRSASWRPPFKREHAHKLFRANDPPSRTPAA